jgi:5-methylcytosine-specific restriction endonuclease McrA
MARTPEQKAEDNARARARYAGEHKAKRLAQQRARYAIRARSRPAREPAPCTFCGAAVVSRQRPKGIVRCSSADCRRAYGTRIAQLRAARQRGPCSVDGCELRHYSGGLCRNHHTGAWRQAHPAEWWAICQRLRGVPADGVAVDYVKHVLLGAPCRYCGGVADAIDHVLSVHNGGGSDWWNLAASCGSCNSSKCHRDVDTWRAGR